MGNNSALPANGRHPTSQVVTFHDRLYLVDCGEGTQMQMSLYKIRRSKIRQIFISHLHGDHYFGLIGLLNSFGLQHRKQSLQIFGPPALKEILDIQFKCADTRLSFDLDFTPLKTGHNGIIVEEEDLTIEVFPTNHRIPCFGFLFREKHKKRKLDPQSALHYKVPVSFYHRLQNGEDYVNEKGERISNELLTNDPPHNRSYAFCADTLYDEKLLDYISFCDLIYHETTYLQNEEERAKKRYHTTSVQAALLARKAHVKKLLIGHFSSKYESLDAFLEECIRIFPNTELSEEGATYFVPPAPPAGGEQR